MEERCTDLSFFLFFFSVFQVDVYSFAVILWEMLVRTKPYEEFEFMWEIQVSCCLVGWLVGWFGLICTGFDFSLLAKKKKKKKKLVGNGVEWRPTPYSCLLLWTIPKTIG